MGYSSEMYYPERFVEGKNLLGMFEQVAIGNQTEIV
jgi:hypothetical protein